MTRQITGFHDDTKKKEPCFHCKMYGCSLRSCRKPKDINRLNHNLNRWRQQRGYKMTSDTFCVVEYVENVSTDEEAVEMFMVISIVNQDDTDFH